MSLLHWELPQHPERRGGERERGRERREGEGGRGRERRGKRYGRR